MASLPPCDLVAEELVADELLLVVDVLLDAVRQHHVVQALVRVARDLRVPADELEVVLEATLPRTALCTSRSSEARRSVRPAHGIDRTTSHPRESCTAAAQIPVQIPSVETVASRRENGVLGGLIYEDIYFASICFSRCSTACGSDPLEPGAGNDPAAVRTRSPSTGSATPRRGSPTRRQRRFQHRVLRADVAQQYAHHDGHRDDHEPERHRSISPAARQRRPLDRGRLPGYDEVYRLDVVGGADKVHGVIVDGPDIARRSPHRPRARRSTRRCANMVKWNRDDEAEIATFRADKIDRLTIPDSGSYTMPPAR